MTSTTAVIDGGLPIAKSGARLPVRPAVAERRCSSADSAARLAATAGDRPKIAGGEAGAADERAIDIGDRHQRARIVRLHGSAIKDADAVPAGEAPPEHG